MTDLLCKERMIHVVGWYDNEWGYASRIADLAKFISECEHNEHRPERAGVTERGQIEARYVRLLCLRKSAALTPL